MHITSPTPTITRTYLVTGATSGLGLQTVLRLIRSGPAHLVLPVRDAARGEQLRAHLLSAGAVRADTPVADLASLMGVAALGCNLLADNSLPLFDGVLLNAGVQAANHISFTGDGFESTFAVNHLAHHLLLRLLQEKLAQSAVVGWTASGTHDPAEVSARMFGFRGGRYSSASNLAKADFGEGLAVAQACRDAYASSKLCNVVSARAFAESQPATAFFSFDPGLMPGTGLARQQGAIVKLAWRHLLPRLVRVLPGASTPARSAAVASRLLATGLGTAASGSYFDFSGARREPSELAREAWVAKDLIRTSDALVAPYLRRGAPA